MKPEEIQPKDIGVTREGAGVCLSIPGYGDKTSADGHGAPILLTCGDGMPPKLYVWADINQEDPTHIIDLDEAQECRRVDD